MKLGDLAAQFQLECRGDPDTEITGIAGLKDAGPGQLTFLFSPAYRNLLAASNASAVVLRPEDSDATELPVILSDNPRMSWAHIAAAFDPAPVSMPFVDGSSSISDLADLGTGVTVGPGAVVSSGARIGDGVALGAGCYVGHGSSIGAGTRLAPGVVLYHDVVVGDRCVIHANSVIGADRFGFEFDGTTGDFVKIPQVYGVRIGSDVEIGAGTTIDRGALNHTEIGDGCKLDNQVQVGHGTCIGHHTVISGRTAIAGSTTIGSYCLIGGAVGIIDNIEIADQVEITAMTLVSQSIVEKGRYSSGTGLMPGNEWKRSIVGFRKLDEILKRLRRLESGQ